MQTEMQTYPHIIVPKHCTSAGNKSSMAIWSNCSFGAVLLLLFVAIFTATVTVAAAATAALRPIDYIRFWLVYTLWSFFNMRDLLITIITNEMINHEICLRLYLWMRCIISINDYGKRIRAKRKNNGKKNKENWIHMGKRLSYSKCVIYYYVSTFYIAPFYREQSACNQRLLNVRLGQKKIVHKISF